MPDDETTEEYVARIAREAAKELSEEDKKREDAAKRNEN